MSTTSLVQVITDASGRPAPPAARDDTGTHAGLPTQTIFALQIFFGVHLVANAAERVGWFSDERTVQLILEHTALIRSFTFSSLTLTAGGAGCIAEVLLVLAVVGAALLIAASTRWINGGDLPGLLATTIVALMLVGGALRLGWEEAAEPSWPSRVVWVVVLAALAFGAVRSLTYRAVQHHGWYDVAVIGAMCALAVIVPLMRSFGFWRNERWFTDSPALRYDSVELEPIRWLLIGGGIVPLAIVAGYLLLRPPVRRWLQLTVGVVALVGGLVYVGHYENVLFGERVPSVGTSSSVSSPSPVSTCAEAELGGGRTLRLTGSRCRAVEFVEAGGEVERGSLPGPVTNVLGLEDPISATIATSVAFQVYGDLLVVGDRSDDGLLGVTAYDLRGRSVVWRQVCPAGTTTLKVRLSGGLAPDAADHARTTETLFELDSYVAFGCDDDLVLLDPADGEWY